MSLAEGVAETTSLKAHLESHSVVIDVGNGEYHHLSRLEIVSDKPIYQQVSIRRTQGPRNQPHDARAYHQDL